MDDVALIVIDVQCGLDEPRLGRRNNPEAESNMARLLAHWRACGRPLVHIQHASTEPNSPLRPERPGFAIKACVQPQNGEAHFVKSVNSAFIGTPLESWLRDRDVTRVVMIGLTTEHCVSTSVRMAANLGLDVVLVEDATAAFAKSAPDGGEIDADTVHRVNILSLQGEFCRVAGTDQLLRADTWQTCAL